MSIQPLGYGQALTGPNAQNWAEQILSDLGAPETAADIQSLMNWFAREGGGGANNPLNTTLRTPDSTGSINSVGVQSYSTPQGGAAADAQTIQGGYPAILAALKSGQGIGNSPQIASELSTWSGGGYSSLSGSPSIGPISTPSATSGSSGGGGNAQDASSLFGLNLGIFQSFSNFFTDITSADIWERIALMIFGVLLIGIGFALLAGPPALQALGISARAGRTARSIGRSFGATDSGGPTPEETADRQRRLQLAETNAETGRQKVVTQQMRERRLSAGVRHSGGNEPNPEPSHAV